MDNPSLSEGELALLLRNRQAPPELLGRIGRDPRWLRHYQVKRGLVVHPRTPINLARGLVQHLRWKELAEACDSATVHPTVRSKAEDLLTVRLAKLTIGERIALARRATRKVIDALIDLPDGRVLKSLLGNRRLVEADVTKIASDTQVPGDLLAFIGAHVRWANERAVILALLHNPLTPIPAALSMIRRLDKRDIRGLASDDSVPTIVRIGADRELSSASARESHA